MFYDHKAVVLAIMDMASAKCDVNGPKKNYVFGDIELESEKIFFSKTYRPSLYWTSQGFYIFSPTRPSGPGWTVTVAAATVAASGFFQISQILHLICQGVSHTIQLSSCTVNIAYSYYIVQIS